MSKSYSLVCFVHVSILFATGLSRALGKRLLSMEAVKKFMKCDVMVVRQDLRDALMAKYLFLCVLVLFLLFICLWYYLVYVNAMFLLYS